MNATEAVKRLYALENQLQAYEHATSLLYLDGVTQAPKGAYKNRGETLSVLGEAAYRLQTAPETLEILETLKSAPEADEKTRRIVELRGRELEETRKIPMDEYLAYQVLLNDADAVWHAAKENDDYASFAPYLDRIAQTLARFASIVRPDLPVYDYLLDKHEPEMTQKDLDAFFEPLKRALTPMIARAKTEETECDRALRARFPVEAQRALSDEVMRVLGLDRQHVGIAETEHPFTINFTRYDVRITTHYYENAFTYGLYSTVHEGGHALYEANTDPAFARTRLGTGVSMAVHESQSRFYENVIGRSRPFVARLAPTIRKLCPALAPFDDEALYKAVIKSQPSLIRTEADELTYCMHILIRYEIEKRLFAGELTVKDLPGEWNRLYAQYLGIAPRNHREGILQDSHWSGGSFGYFPSYALGSAYSAQLYAKMRETVPVEADIARGDLSRVNDWLRARIWRYGSLKTPKALMEAAFEGPFRAEHYLDYLKEKYENA